MGSQGDAYDNALAESVIGLFKTEVIRRKGPWRSLEAVEFATLAWVDWFQHAAVARPDRRHTTGGVRGAVLCPDQSGLFNKLGLDDPGPLHAHVEHAATAAKLTHQGIHILRHTFCSHLAMAGAPAKAIQELAGHTDLKTTLRYMHLNPAASRSVIDLSESRPVGDILETEVTGTKNYRFYWSK